MKLITLIIVSYMSVSFNEDVQVQVLNYADELRNGVATILVHTYSCSTVKANSCAQLIIAGIECACHSTTHQGCYDDTVREVAQLLYDTFNDEDSLKNWFAAERVVALCQYFR